MKRVQRPKRQPPTSTICTRPRHPPRRTYRSKRGYFEDLSFVIAAAFDPTSDGAKNLDKDWTEGGLLILSDIEKRNIKASMGKYISAMEKFHDIVSYQLELGYDLAICPSLNVSRSPGYESVLGIYGGNE